MRVRRRRWVEVLFPGSFAEALTRAVYGGADLAVGLNGENEFPSVELPANNPSGVLTLIFDTGGDPHVITVADPGRPRELVAGETFVRFSDAEQTQVEVCFGYEDPAMFVSVISRAPRDTHFFDHGNSLQITHGYILQTEFEYFRDDVTLLQAAIDNSRPRRTRATVGVWPRQSPSESSATTAARSCAASIRARPSS